jgi:hypothetical protein
MHKLSFYLLLLLISQVSWVWTGEQLGRNKQEVTERWRKLRKEELRNLFSAPNIIGMMRIKDD